MDDYTTFGVWGLVLSAVQLLGVVHAAHAVLRVRHPQAAVGWGIALLTFPWVALPLYWVFGRNRFAGYQTSRRAGKERIDELARRALDRLAEFRADVPGTAGQLCATGERLTGIPCTEANDVDLLTDGAAAFTTILDAVKSAKSYVLMQFFIVEEGRLSGEFARVLTEKARQGVRVHFLYDEVGSHRLGHRYPRQLTQAGVRVSSYRAVTGRRHRLQLNFRNHRKTTIVDGRVAFVGGLNLADEYAGCSPKLGPWRDTHVSVRGPVVQAIQLAFLEDWHWATGETPDLTWEPCAAAGRSHKILALPTGPADRIEAYQLFLLDAIHAAREKLWIASPYFVPDPAVCAALQLAVVRGVDVRVLLPHNPDHLLVYLAAFSYYEEMLLAGVKLYRYQPGFMHQKVLLIDEALATVGTANLDSRSFHLNFEMTLAVADHEFAAEIRAMLERDFGQSRQARLTDFTERGLTFRLAVLVSRLLAPIL